MTRVKYPAAPRVDLIEIRHGIPVADPFRPLENGDDPATAAWVDAENRLTRELLDTPHRHRLVERLRVLHRFTRMSVPAVRGARIFFTENDGKKNQAVLYGVEARDSGLGTRGSGLGARDSGLGGRGSGRRARGSGRRGRDSGLGGRGSGLERRMLVDPNALDADGTTALTAFEPDDRGGRVVYALSRDGSDMQELRVHDVASGAVLSDVVRWVKFASIAWTDDGFFYTRFPAPQTVPPEHAQYFCQVWFHRLGEAQETDRLVYERPDAPEVVFDVDVTSDGRLLVITSRRGASDDAEVHVVRLKPDPTGPDPTGPDPTGPDPTGDTFTLSPVASGVSRTIVSGFSSGWHFIDGVDDHLYFWTDAGAPLGRVVRFDLRDTHAEPRDVIAESADKISLAVVSRGRLFVSYLVNASDRLRMFELDGRPAGEIELPGPGTIVGLAGRWSDDACYLTFTSFTAPPQILVCDVDARRATPIEPCATTIDPSQYLTEQAWYRSKDGTRVSMFLVRRVDVTLPAPVVLSGYGGFNISLTPTFDPSDFLWLDAGGMIAVANLRGGGEYGEAWHRAGMLDRKQNVFDDFIAAAEWLLATGRAAPGGIAIEGGSNGGLLVGAVMTQRPELFGAVVCRVPVADMLRYHLFTVGRFWIPEYGCADDPKQCTYLLRYSPYHNVRDGVSYPPTLVMTADTDDRVAPGMAKKFAARLQEAVLNTTGGPILLRVETRAGHGIGKPVQKQVDEQADIYEFLFHYVTRATASEHLRRNAG